MRFLVIEFDGSGLVMGRFTRDHPGTTLDTIVEAATDEKGEPVAWFVFLARGLDARGKKELQARLEATYGPVTTLREDLPRGRMRARIQDPRHEAELLASMKAALAERGADAQVEVEELAAHDYGPWEELVQTRMGLFP